MKAWPILLLVVAPVAIAAAVPKHKHSLKDLRRKEAIAHRKRAALAHQKHLIERKAHVVRGDIQSIDQEISDHLANIAKIRDRLARNRVQEKVLAKQLDVETKRLQVRSEQARERIREMYMQGDATLASAVVGSSSMGDLASRQFVFERVAQRDRQLFEEVKELRQNVVDKKTQVDQLAVQIKKDLADEQTAKAELQDERQDKSDALQDLKDQEGQIEQLLHELDQEDSEIESEIAQYEAGAGSGLVFHGRFMVPVFHARLASSFGMRYHPILHRMRMHTGQDFAAPWGSPIHAAADGVVVTCRYMRGYGNAIVVDHGSGLSTLYGHCSRIIARPGQRVSKGEVIALVGATGLATGPHCHFEVRVKGRPVNPMGYLR